MFRQCWAMYWQCSAMFVTHAKMTYGMRSVDDKEKLKNFSASETLILFKPYEKPLEIIQENLRLRNQYNQLKSGGKKDDIKVMEDAIQKQIESLLFSPELYIYSLESDNCLKI